MSSGGDSSRGIRRQEEQRQANIRQGMESIDRAFAGFTPDFYSQRSRDYLKFALPGLAQQAANTWNNLTAKLANQGLLRSSAAGRLGSSLKLEQGRQQQAVADESVNQANQLRQNVEDKRTNLVSQLNLSADPYSTAQSALGTAAGLTGPSTFAPLTGLFNNWSNMYLASQVARTNPQMGAMYLANPGGVTFNVGQSSNLIR